MTKNNHGGKREGAGRKPTGTTKKVSITLADETWEQIEQAKQDKNISQSSLFRTIIESHYKPADDERSIMWWELVRKNIFEGYVEIKKSVLHDCIEYRRYSKELANEVWERCINSSKEYSKPRVSYLLEAFRFEGKRLLMDKNFESMEEQIIFSVIEYVRTNRIK